MQGNRKKDRMTPEQATAERGGSTLIRWAIIGSAGLLLVTAAVFVERQRTRLIARAQEWREALEAWE